MIYIRIEMWPKGSQAHARVLGEATITNTGGAQGSCGYALEIFKSPEYASAHNVGKTWRRGVIERFPRLKLGPWDLLLQLLLVALRERNRSAIEATLRGRSLAVIAASLLVLGRPLPIGEPRDRETLHVAAGHGRQEERPLHRHRAAAEGKRHGLRLARQVRWDRRVSELLNTHASEGIA